MDVFEVDPTTFIPDSSRDIIGVATPSTSLIVNRVIKRKGAKVLVAAFQSSV